ncbi:hypothetical protein EG329_012428 [Mollisiaceae sp. DMI_Dod_QoI]|nr:hypothetical protein EG329_012428 [Helotiales sp. DMI_Dod_QoI]
MSTSSNRGQDIIMSTSQGLSTSILASSNAQAFKQQKPVNLTDLPIDIIFCMFEQSLADDDLTTIVSLGLTCRSFYHILKSIHPSPIILNNTDKRNYFQLPGPRRLHDSLPKVAAAFLGDQYRGVWTLIRGKKSYHFLNKSVYGKEKSIADARFHQRMGDYAFMMDLNDHQRVDIDLIPCPLGKGEEWYEEVADVIESLDMSSWTQEEVDFWVDLRLPPLLDRIRTDRMMSAWTEWTAMVGF